MKVRTATVVAFGVVASLAVVVWRWPHRPVPDSVSERVGSLLDSDRSQHGRAGVLPARFNGGEFGVIDGARMSPNGRWVAVLDQTPPFIKLINDSGVAVSAIRLISDSASRLAGLPVMAISDKRVMVVRRDARRTELYDFQGRLQAVAGLLDFFPITATAVNDSVWLVYGPSNALTNGKANWIHCLYSGNASTRWGEGYLDGVDSIATGDANIAVPYVSGDRVELEHRQRHSSVILSADCGDGIRAPTAIVEAHGFTKRPNRTSATAPASRQFQELDGLFGSGFARIDTTLWNIATGATARLTFAPVRADAPAGRLDIPGDYRLVDSRTGVGLLFEDPTDIPMLLLVPERDLQRAFSGSIVPRAQHTP